MSMSRWLDRDEAFVTAFLTHPLPVGQMRWNAFYAGTPPYRYQRATDALRGWSWHPDGGAQQCPFCHALTSLLGAATDIL